MSEISAGILTGLMLFFAVTGNMSGVIVVGIVLIGLVIWLEIIDY